MEKLRKIKLTQLSNTDLDELEMSLLLGSGCTCGCYYANLGGSNSTDNGYANTAGNLSSIPISGSTSGSGSNPSYTYSANCFHIDDNYGCSYHVDCDGGIVHGKCTN